MRVTGGKHRGRRIEAGPGREVRPTAIRARQALFNILAHSPKLLAHPPLPAEARVVDVFAGSGALGFEALSRGARHVTFIDNDDEALGLVKRNAAHLDEAERISVLRRDATQPGRASVPCDLAFLDPPYRSGLAAPALAALEREEWLRPGAIAVVELALTEPFTPPAGFEMVETRVYGAAKVVIVRKSS
jgi:16S rRNA (guanine966-N2)-methyltransferase